ncbi:zf-DHHC-domain-containing protein [Zychaea mexicana]|uniref:zf-DHHC-domain-containing protein n=1 Tax=Zychaea mexicana TaxID=64656 RepID=UPI0022FEE404|nr:zf-DHHC-domain-containing protein [Zychaea mexicana]KAI9490160.1 zf-DHHC-domain-containing protein [Zychaea mexicana]
MSSSSLAGRLYTVGVSLLIASIAYPSQFFLFAPGFQDAASCIKALLPLNLLVLMVYWNYYLAVKTDPGQVPEEWVRSLLVPCNEERRAEGITGPRYCKTCDIYKPPRTHHCRYCRRCVLKMDHHCPWINNCVGYHNYPHFVRFTLYVSVASLYILILLIWRVRTILNDLSHFRFDSEPTTAEVILYVVEFALAIIVLFCVGMLCVYHLYCLARNQSTIEGWERSKVNRLIRRGKISPVKYPFDVGFYRNICLVMGNNPLLWLWPQQVRGDGLTFPVISHTGTITILDNKSLSKYTAIHMDA